LDLTAKDNETSAAITIFNATIDSIFYSTDNGTINTNINQSLGAEIDITFNAEGHFSKTYSSYNTSTDLTGYLLDYPTITTSDNETLSSINNFNISMLGFFNETTTGSINFPYQNLKTFTIDSSGYNPQVITHNFENATDLDISLFYTLARMSFKAVVLPSNVTQIDIFTINVTSLNSSLTATGNTTNGTLNIAVPRETLNITIDSLDYTLDSAVINPYYDLLYTFALYPTNSINLNIFDLDTSLLIDDRQINITINGVEYLTGSTTNGTFFTEGLLPGVYQLDLVAPNFAPNTYYFTLADRTHQTLNTYLSGSCNEVTFNIVDSYQSALDGVIVTFNQQINGSWSEIGQRTTDVSGAIEMCLQEELHMIQATKTGYETWEGDLTPYNSAYSIILDIIGSQVYESLFDDITFLFSPTASTLNTNSTDFTLTAYSPSGKILYFGLNTTYNGTSYITNSTTSASGGAATITLPLSEDHQHFKVTYFVYSVTGSSYTWDQSYQYYDYAVSQYSLVYLFNEWEAEEGNFTVLFWVYVLLIISTGLLMLTGADKVVLVIWGVLFIGIFSSPLIGAIPVGIGIIQCVVLVLLAVAMGKRGML